MKFIADVMLGRLAKRLRLLGLDVLYDNALDDNEILRLSLDEGRVILTRDAALAARPLAANHLFVSSDRVGQQVEQIISAFPVETRPLTRCSECNEPLTPLARQEARDVVPPYVYETQKEFLQCSRCGRMYWKGSHVKKMALPAREKKK